MESVSATTSSGPKLHFPIEGHSIWPVILWMLMFSSIVAVVVVGLILNMVEISNLPVSENALTGVVAGFMALEYLAVLKLVVPNMTDYGRYRVYPDHVDFFPLVMLGLCVNNKAATVQASDFKGVRIHIHVSKDRPTLYRVDLVHAAKGKTLRLKNFLDMPDAELYARELAAAMKLTVLEAA
jgi:hypothetical protein